MSGIAPITTQSVQATESAGSTAAGAAQASPFQAQGAESSGTSKSADNWNPTAKEVQIFKTAAQETVGEAEFIENVKKAVDQLKQSDPAFAQELGTSSPYSDPTKVDQYLSEQFAIVDDAARTGDAADLTVSGGSASAQDKAREGELSSVMKKQSIATNVNPDSISGSLAAGQIQGLPEQFGSSHG